MSLPSDFAEAFWTIVLFSVLVQYLFLAVAFWLSEFFTWLRRKF